MSTLSPGANAPVPSGTLTIEVKHALIPGADIDVSAFLVTASGKVRSDEDMCFYGQPSVAGGAVQQTRADNGNAQFSAALDRLPADIEKVVITATIHENKAAFGRLSDVMIDVSGVRGQIPCAGMEETALILAELYKRNGAWKLRVVGQGFKGGLAPLATHLGVSIDDEPAAAAPAPVASKFEKRMIDLQKKDPEMVSLVKKVQVSLDKRGIGAARAKVALCLDISGSMSRMFSQGKVDILVSRAMALGYKFDDDGEIDVFLFGKNFHTVGTVGVDGYRGLVGRIRETYSLEGDTLYGKAMEGIRAFYRKQGFDDVPVFVMFVTDGSTGDKPKTERQLRESSHEPIFWKFMGIIEDGMFAQRKLEFLERLDELKDRRVDNANFFQIKDPAEPTDEQMFENLLNEYDVWLKDAKREGIL